MKIRKKEKIMFKIRNANKAIKLLNKGYDPLFVLSNCSEEVLDKYKVISTALKCEAKLALTLSRKKNTRQILRCASERLRGDAYLVGSALLDDPSAFCEVPEEQRNDPKFSTLTLDFNEKAIMYSEFKNDPEFLKFAIEQNLDIFAKNEEFYGNKELASIYIQNLNYNYLTKINGIGSSRQENTAKILCIHPELYRGLPNFLFKAGNSHLLKKIDGYIFRMLKTEIEETGTQESVEKMEKMYNILRETREQKLNEPEIKIDRRANELSEKFKDLDK